MSTTRNPTRALADFAFGSHSRIADTSRPLAWLSSEELAIDLSDPVQRRFGDYELVEQIGQGGMGVVYRARQHGLERDVAIKLLAAGPWASDEFVERFRREARSAARMQHPNIVEIYEFGHRDGLNYFSMRLVEGRSLAERLAADGPMEPRAAARLLRTLAEAMDYAHRLGVLHLDLKPGNVLLTREGEPLIADFGLARRIDAGHERGEVAGTPSYMAPEQALLESHPLSASTDIWGLGAILYECLTGRPPFLAPDAQRTLERVVGEPPQSPHSQRPDIPRDLDAICLKCLEKDPAQRYAGARELADDLRRFDEGEPVTARSPGALESAWRWMQRNQWATGMIAVVLIGIASSTWQAWRAEEARAMAAARASEAQAQRVLAEANAQRNEQLLQLMAAAYPDAGGSGEQDPQSRSGTALVDWLRRNIGSDDAAQAEILVALVEALKAEGKLAAAQQLLMPVVLGLGEGFRAEAAGRLIASGEGRKLALAVTLMQGDGNPDEATRLRQAELLARAVALAPGDRDVLLIAALYCEHPTCAALDAGIRLAEREPGNAVNWLIAARWQAEDPARVDALLEPAAQSDAFDDHFASLYRLGREAMTASGLPLPRAILEPAAAISGSVEPERLLGYLFQSQALPIPAFQPFVHACNVRERRAAPPLPHAACLRFARLAANEGKGLISQMIGSAMVRRLLPGSEEAIAMRELRRQYLYTFETFTRLTPDQQRRADLVRMADELMEVSELEAFKRILDRAGVPRDAPPDWLPEEPTALMIPEERTLYAELREQAKQRAEGLR